MLYFPVTLSKPKFAKNTLQEHTCSRAAETLGAGEVLNGQNFCSILPPSPAGLGVTSLLPNLHWASSPWLRGFVAREWGGLSCWASSGCWGWCLLHPGCFGSKSWLWGAAEPRHVLMEIISSYGSYRDALPIGEHAQLCSPPALSWHNEEAGDKTQQKLKAMGDGSPWSFKQSFVLGWRFLHSPKCNLCRQWLPRQGARACHLPLLTLN